jgi:hypothetical protein
MMLRNVNKLSGTVAGERLLYLSLNLVCPRIFIFSFLKKSYLWFCLTSTFTPATQFTLVSFAFFLISTL